MSHLIRKKRARLAALTRHHPDDEHVVAKRDLRAEVLAEYIKRTVDQAPPLTAAQRDRLAGLLRGTGTPDSRGAA